MVAATEAAYNAASSLLNGHESVAQVVSTNFVTIYLNVLLGLMGMAIAYSVLEEFVYSLFDFVNHATTEGKKLYKAFKTFTQRSATMIGSYVTTSIVPAVVRGWIAVKNFATTTLLSFVGKVLAASVIISVIATAAKAPKLAFDIAFPAPAIWIVQALLNRGIDKYGRLIESHKAEMLSSLQLMLALGWWAAAVATASWSLHFTPEHRLDLLHGAGAVATIVSVLYWRLTMFVESENKSPRFVLRINVAVEFATAPYCFVYELLDVAFFTLTGYYLESFINHDNDDVASGTDYAEGPLVSAILNGLSLALGWIQHGVVATKTRAEKALYAVEAAIAAACDWVPAMLTDLVRVVWNGVDYVAETTVVSLHRATTALVMSIRAGYHWVATKFGRVAGFRLTGTWWPCPTKTANPATVTTLTIWRPRASLFPPKPLPRLLKSLSRMEVHEVPLYFNESRDVTLKWNKAKDLFSSLLVVEQLRTIERVGVPKCKCGQVWTEILRAATQRHSEGYRTLVVPAWYIAKYIK